MWKYTEVNAYDSISLHDCRADHMQLDGNNLVIDFPEGFWITPRSKHIAHDRPLKTGPSQLRFMDVSIEPLIESIYLFKDIRMFRKVICCRRIQLGLTDLLKLINDGKHELEFLYEFHNSLSNLYQCWIWKSNRGLEAECQLELTASQIEYSWNDIQYDNEW